MRHWHDKGDIIVTATGVTRAKCISDCEIAETVHVAEQSKLSAIIILHKTTHNGPSPKSMLELKASGAKEEETHAL